jgi:hypothetical protein
MRAIRWEGRTIIDPEVVSRELCRAVALRRHFFRKFKNGNLATSTRMLWLVFLLLTHLSSLSGRPLKDDSPLVVLITGCSTGIGKSLALEFGHQPNKYKVWATMRSTSNWDYPQMPNFNVLEMDVSSSESVEAAVRQIVSIEGKIDVVINNAGYGMVGSVETVDISDGKVSLSDSPSL